MKVVVLGAGMIGISTVRHLLERGHQVTVVERQPDAALETSFANAAQISARYCEPWANRDAPLKALMRKYGVERRVVSTAELLAIEPALRLFAHRIVGGTFTASDESGDARVFTQALAKRCAARGAAFLYSHAVARFERDESAIKKVAVKATNAETTGMNATENEVVLAADAFVVTCGSYSTSG